MSGAIVLFAKAPRPYQVKTRLTPTVSAEDAASLHDAFVRDLWERVRAVTPDSCFLCCDSAWSPYTKLVGTSRVIFQCRGDLGARLLQTFEAMYANGYSRILIVGGDSPTIPVDTLRKGLDALKSKDAVLGPTLDGGYYAVGCRAPRAEMFDQVLWSSPSTLEDTQRAFKRIHWSTARLPKWYDVDTIDDLRLLAKDPGLGEHSRKWFLKHQNVSDEVDFEIHHSLVAAASKRTVS